MPWFGKEYYDPNKKKWSSPLSHQHHPVRNTAIITSFIFIIGFGVLWFVPNIHSVAKSWTDSKLSSITAMAKTTSSATANTATSKVKFTVPNGSLSLKVIREWTGTSDQTLHFSTDKGPWVINVTAIRTSGLAASFDVGVSKDNAIIPELGEIMPIQSGPNVFYGVINATGNFTIYITASGCKWDAKIGIQ